METLMGVYTITHIASGKQYIGASIHVMRRWGHHRYQLRHGRHRAHRLQQDWDCDGPDAFRLAIVEHVAVESALAEAERRWIVAQRPAYNVPRHFRAGTTGWRRRTPIGVFSDDHLAHIRAGVGRYLSTSEGKAARYKYPPWDPHLPVPPALMSAFAAKVDRAAPHGCWLWTGTIDNNGYGRMYVGGGQVGGREVTTHRLAYHIAHGPIPAGLWVLHACDASYAPDDVTYRRCVNVAHLSLGTNADNMRHAAALGRSAPQQHKDRVPRGATHYYAQRPQAIPRGEQLPWTRLTSAAVREIRARHAAGGVTYSALARAYGVSPATISRAVRGIDWGHLDRD